VLKRILALIVGVSFIAGCSGGGGGSSDAGTSGGSSSSSSSGSEAVNSSCAPEHAGNVKWTYSNCGPLVNGQIAYIDQATAGDNGELLGARAVDKGRVTYTFTNLDWSMLPWPTDDIMFMIFMGNGNDPNFTILNNEANWHILGNRFAANGRIETRIVTQRFDGVCIPETVRYCEKKWLDYDMPKYSATSTYKWDCAWDTTASSGLNNWGTGVGDGLVKCDLYNADDANNPVLIESYMVPTSGSYPSLNYFMAGGNSSERFHKTNMPVTLTNFRFSIIE